MASRTSRTSRTARRKNPKTYIPENHTDQYDQVTTARKVVIQDPETYYAKRGIEYGSLGRNRALDTLLRKFPWNPAGLSS